MGDGEFWPRPFLSRHPRGGNVPTPRAASSHRRPAHQGGTHLPGQMRPRLQVVQATLLTLPGLLCPSPARPHSRGEALPPPAEGFSCLLSPRPQREGLSPKAGYRAQAQWTSDGLAGGQPALPSQERAAPAGRSDTALGAYLPRPSPTFLGGSRAQGAQPWQEPGK